MKKIILLLILVVIATNLQAQDQLKKNTFNNNIQKKQSDAAVYQLFPTQNMWTFIKLNTRNGQMWQVQYNIEGKSRFVTNLNSISLVLNEKEINGRFTLYPTQNIWTFILLDQIDGSTWQVQWSTEAENRGVIPIE